MPCSSPLQAFQLSSGEVVFSERAGRTSVRSLSLPCGQCVRCKLERSRQWAVRCVHEASLYDRNCFLTLTYDDGHVPENLGLRHLDFQKFIRRLRRRFFSSTIRYYMCGEYGDVTSRPHFHALLFGFDFEDKLYFKKSKDGSLYTSSILDDVWRNGHSLIGEVTFESAAYVARYCVQMATVDPFDRAAYYCRLNKATGEVYAVPREYNRMSLKPAIGKPWYDRFKREVYPLDEVVVQGRSSKPPKYYDRLLKRESPEAYVDLQKDRDEKMCSAQVAADNTWQRLDVKERVARARLLLKARSV